MRVRIASGALLALLTFPPAAWGQDTSVADTQLQMETKRTRVIVHPTPPREVVERDIERAPALAEERRERIIREVTRPVSRRPDLDYAVTSGIQAQNLQRIRR